jgi:hypothetical protein
MVGFDEFIEFVELVELVAFAGFDHLANFKSDIEL